LAESAGRPDLTLSRAARLDVCGERPSSKLIRRFAQAA
jgi:hypothetical protein